VCQLDPLHIQLKVVQGFPCPADFSDGKLGICGGNALTGRGWGGARDGVAITWATLGQTQSVTYGADGYGTREPYGGSLTGWVPVGTKAFYVLHGGNTKQDFFYTDWYTPSTAGVAPGDQGGPLYLDYTPGNLVIRGFLYNTCNFGCHPD
jgi:hypothetical protein